MALALASNLRFGLCCSSPNLSFVADAADNEKFDMIVPDGVVAMGLNESANAGAADEESQAIGHIPFVVRKDTDGCKRHAIATTTLDFDTMSTDGNENPHDFWLNTALNNKDKSIHDRANDELVDTYVVVKNGADNIATVITATDSPILGATVHRKTHTHFHHTEDWKMPPDGETTHKQYQNIMDVIQLPYHHERAFAIVHQHDGPLPRELMRYHPIDRGRCICHFPPLFGASFCPSRQGHRSYHIHILWTAISVSSNVRLHVSNWVVGTGSPTVRLFLVCSTLPTLYHSG